MLRRLRRLHRVGWCRRRERLQCLDGHLRQRVDVVVGRSDDQ
jgi:hypothetical protein